jgi:hypothetical protein
LDSAEAALAKGDISTAEDIVASVLRKASKAKAADDDYEDVSNPSLDSDDDDDGDSDEDSDGDDQDEDDDDVSKAWHEHSTSHSPARMRTSHVRVHQPETYRVSATPQPEGPGKRHRFMSRVDHIRDRDGVSRTEAMSRARQEFPETYTDYQDHLSRRSTGRQHMVRGHNLIGKSASTSYEALVAEQIAKGCNAEIAAQRVCQMYGFRALDSQIYKGQNIMDRWQAKVEKLADDYGLSLDDACRELRRADPLLFKALQIV